MDADPNQKQRLILLLDGTWNDSEFNQRDTNIVRMREVIARSLTLRGERGQADPKTLVLYLRGVGTDTRLDRFLGGALGYGLDENIRRGYKFLSRHYRLGDEVHLFGFSRGAFTARSLAGFIGAAGLLRAEACTPELENLAWSYYRTRPDDRSPGIWHRLAEHVHPREESCVNCLGVFDTVGALGVPLSILRAFNRMRFQFHNVELPSNTMLNLHAIALDEQRLPFAAAVWRRHKFKPAQNVTEQVWFPGVHADVGGGYADGEARVPGSPALDDFSLDWMMRRVKKQFADFPWDADAWPAIAQQSALAPQHESRGGFYELLRRGLRAIGNLPVPVTGYAKTVSRDRHARPVGEMVHVAALERLGQRVPCDNTRITYAPPALVAMLDDIAATYGATPARAPRMQAKVVDWTGDPFNPDDPAQAAQVLGLIAAARGRLSGAVT